MERKRQLTIVERLRVPLDGAVLGWVAVLPHPLAVVCVWLGSDGLVPVILRLTVIWSAAIVIFLAGVRRGLSFRTPGGPRASQIVMMFWLFSIGLLALLLPVRAALWLLWPAFITLLLVDPRAALAQEVPLYFARLRPRQMLLPVICLPLLAVR